MVEKSMLDEAARAAGALAIRFDRARDEAFLEGELARFALPSPSLQPFSHYLAASDRNRLDALKDGEVDLRVRLAGADGEVRYGRLMGRCEGGVLTGLLLPAGTGPGAALATLDMEAALASGLQSGEIVAHYQPIVSLESERLVGFEALARWERPDTGLLGPQEFFTTADRLGLSARIGETVRASAASGLSRLHRREPHTRALYVSANASVGELLSEGFVERLTGAVDKAGLARSRFRLEITETEIMREPERAAGILDALKCEGIGLLLDDFGTGYSSLARLDRFPFDIIKIDQYFVRAMLTDRSARSITASVVKLARNLGMVIVAEGVETQEMADLAGEMGCDYAQGFLYAGALDPLSAYRAGCEGIQGRFGAPAFS